MTMAPAGFAEIQTSEGQCQSQSQRERRDFRARLGGAGTAQRYWRKSGL